MWDSKKNSENNLVKEITDKIKSSNLKIFPDDFLYSENYYEEIIPDKTLVVASELFGKYEIKTSDGEFFKMVDSIHLAKYYVYSSTRRKSVLKIPKEKSALIEVITEYERYFDNLVKKIQSEIDKSGLKVNKLNVTNSTIFSLNLVRF